MSNLPHAAMPHCLQAMIAERSIDDGVFRI